MSRSFVKVFTAILDDPDLIRLGHDAYTAYIVLIILAGKCDYGGKLTIRTGPLTWSEMASKVLLTPARMKAAVTSLCSAGFVSGDERGGFEVVEFDRWQEPKDQKAAARQKAHRDRRIAELESLRNGRDVTLRNGVNNGVTDANSIESREVDGRDVDKSLPTVETPGAVAPKPHRAAKSVTPVPEGPSFGDLEPEIVVYLANAAAENKTGKITESRIAGIRFDLQAALEGIGSREAFAHGLRAANAKGAANVNYVRKAAESYQPAGAQLGFGHRRPEVVLPPRYDASEPIR